jgi:H/ACA ribonucleoprotein complex subunit 3
MKTVYLNGQAIRLTKEIGAGQEAVVYDMGNSQVAKIYRFPDDPYYAQSTEEQKAAKVRIAMHQKKLAMYPGGLPSNIIVPSNLLTDKQGIILGYTMSFITGAETLLKYGDMSYRQSMNISNNEIKDIFLNLHDTVRSLHDKKVIIGDFNDLNILVKNKQVYMIDTDSYQFDNWVSTMYTEKFVDPLLCDVMLKNNDPFWTMTRNHNYNGDWYGFTSLLFKSLLFVDPYGGIYKPKDPNNRIKQQLRASKRINVFNPEVVYPKHAYPYNVLDGNIIRYFQDVFNKDRRGEFPQALLKNMQWKSCNACGIEYATTVCPICNAGHIHIFAPISVSGNVQVKEVFVTGGIILFADVQNGKLVYLYHENDQYKRETDRVVIAGSLSRNLHIAINGTSTVLSESHTMAVIDQSGKSQKMFIDCVGSRAVCDANDHQIFWVENGNIYKNNPLGLEYSPINIGQAIVDNTLLWTGEKFGFGIYKAGNILQGFMFDDISKVINDNVNLPFIKGQIIDAKTYISDNLAWLMIATKDQTKYINHCIVLNKHGKILTHINNDILDEAWLSHIKGKSAFGNYLFCPTDDGIIRVGVDSNGQIETKVFVDTENYVNEQSSLLVSPMGIYVIKRNKIILVSIK